MNCVLKLSITKCNLKTKKSHYFELKKMLQTKKHKKNTTKFSKLLAERRELNCILIELLVESPTVPKTAVRMPKRSNF